MEILTKPLSSEKVVRPALIYSLFPNVPPTIYFSTRDERGKPSQVSKLRRALRRRTLAKLGGGSKMVATFPEWLLWCSVPHLVHRSDLGTFFLFFLELTLLNPISSFFVLSL